MAANVRPGERFGVDQDEATDASLSEGAGDRRTDRSAADQHDRRAQ